MTSRMVRSAFQCRSMRSLRSCSRLFSSAWILTRGEKRVSTSSISSSFSFSRPLAFSSSILKQSSSVSWFRFSSVMIVSQCRIARASSFSFSSSPRMFECDSSWLRLCRSGLSSFTVGRNAAPAAWMFDSSGEGGCWGPVAAGVVAPASMVLEPREREEPRLDLEDRFRRSFMRLLISLMCSSRIFSREALRLVTSSPLALLSASLFSISFLSRLAWLRRVSFSLSRAISFSLYSRISLLSSCSTLPKCSSFSASCPSQSAVSSSMRRPRALAVSSCFFFSLASSRVRFYMPMVFSSTSSLSLRSCFSMYWLVSLREVTMPLVRDRSSSRLLFRSLISRRLSSSSCMIFLLSVLISPVLSCSSLSQLTLRVSSSCSFSSTFELWVSIDARSCAISLNRNSTSLLWLLFSSSASSCPSLLYFSWIARRSACLEASFSLSCRSSESMVLRQALACASQLLFILELDSISACSSLFLLSTVWVSRSFSELSEQFSIVNSLIAGSRPRMGLPLLAIQCQKLLQLSMLIRQLPPQIISQLAHRAVHTMSVVGSLHEFREGGRFWQSGNYETALEYYERGLGIVGLGVAGGGQEVEAICKVVHELGQCYAWTGRIGKVKEMARRVTEVHGEEGSQIKGKLKDLVDAVQIVSNDPSAIQDEFRKQIATIYQQAPIQLPDIAQTLTAKPAATDTNQANLAQWSQAPVKSTFTYLLTLLLADPASPNNPHFNATCSALLKKAEKQAPKDLPKALLLLSSNLLRAGQYMQAEGMLAYCLDRKREHLKPSLLPKNQQNVLLQLLKAHCLSKLKREEEGHRLVEEYRDKFSLEALVLQSQLIDSL